MNFKKEGECMSYVQFRILHSVLIYFKIGYKNYNEGEMLSHRERQNVDLSILNA